MPGFFQFRPLGYEYPTGLNTKVDTTLVTVNVAPTTTGGTQTVDGTNAVHSFTSSGDFVTSSRWAGTAEYLILSYRLPRAPPSINKRLYFLKLLSSLISIIKIIKIKIDIRKLRAT